MNELAIVLRFAIALALIAALLGALGWSARTLRGRLPAIAGRRLRVVETALLSNGSAMHIVRAGTQTLVVGSAHGSVTLLSILSGDEAEAGVAL